MRDYRYTFTYQHGDNVYTLVCSAEITMDDLKRELMYFLRGCSWSEEQTKFLETEEDS